MQSPPHSLTQRPPTPPTFGGLEEVVFGGGGEDVVEGRVLVGDGGGEVSILRVVVVVDSVAGLAVLSLVVAIGGLDGTEEMEGSTVSRLPVVDMELPSRLLGLGAPAVRLSMAVTGVRVSAELSLSAVAVCESAFLDRIVAPRPAPTPIAMATSNETTHAVMKKVLLLRPNILRSSPGLVFAPASRPHTGSGCDAGVCMAWYC